MLQAGPWLADRTAGQISSACSYFLIGLRPDSVGGQRSHKTRDKNNLLQKERGAEYRKCSGVICERSPKNIVAENGNCELEIRTVIICW